VAPDGSSTADPTATPATRPALRLGALLRKDLLLEWRRKEQLAAMGAFTLLAATLFVFAVDPSPTELSRLAPGALWISFLFAGTLGLAKTFGPEERSGALTALLLAPVDRTGLFLAKAASAAIFMGIMEALMAPVFFALFDLPLLPILPRFALVAGLATAGFCLIGTLVAFAAARAAARELLLPLLLLPLVLPLLIAAARTTRILLEGPEGPAAESLPLWLALMAAFDVIFGVLCCWGFERAVEE
jgi:heme exporter protein B